MIPSSLSHDAKQHQDELLEDARASIGLLADNIWTTPNTRQEEDIYRRLNRDLWIRSCKIAVKYAEIQAGGVCGVPARLPLSGKKFVRDVIPDSRLASYGNFEYNIRETESLPFGCSSGSSSSDEDTGANGEKLLANGDTCQQPKEPWMLDEVEEYVARMKSFARRRRRGPQTKQLMKYDGILRDSKKTDNQMALDQKETNNSQKKPIKEPNEMRQTSASTVQPPRYNVKNVSEAQLEGRIFSETVRSIWYQRRASDVELNNNSQKQKQHRQMQLDHQLLARGLRRELGLLQRPSYHQQSTTKRANPDVQQTHSSFQNERLKMPSNSRCQYPPYVQTLSVAQHPAPPSLYADVPEFFPKGGGGSSSTPSNIPWTSIEDKPQYYATMAENPYQEDMLFPYKSHHRIPGTVTAPSAAAVAQHRKTTTPAAVAIYQNTLMPMVPTPIVSAVVWPSQVWSQRMVPAAAAAAAAIQIHQMAPLSCTPLPPPQVNQPMAMQQQQQQPSQIVSSAAMCQTVVHRPIRIQESSTKASMAHQSQSQIPPTSQKVAQVAQASTYQRCNKSTSEYNQRRKSQGVDFNNLILLTKSAMKVRRNQSKSSKKFFIESSKATSMVGKADGSSSTRWFDKGYQTKREREYVTVSTKSSSRHHYQHHSINIESTATNKVGSSKTISSRTDDEDYSSAYSSSLLRTTPSASSSSSCSSRKRLYRDVLGSSGSVELIGSQEKDELRIEAGFDELERQALEQYRTSEECITLRYQELEQQALEQYRTTGSSDSINLGFESNTASTFHDNEDNPLLHGADNLVVEDNDVNPDCRGYTAGFGKYSPRKKHIVAGERGDNPQHQNQYYRQQRVKILKSGSKASSTTAVTALHKASSEGCLRPIAVARRLNSIANFVGSSNHHVRESKNTLRGTSGEKIVKTSSLSSLKRRPMPMSPLECNSNSTSGTNLTRNAAIDPLKTVQNLDKYVVATYYRNAKVIQTSGGDDKVNHKAGVYLTDFWS